MLLGGAVETATAAETVMAATVETTLGGSVGVLTDITAGEGALGKTLVSRLCQFG